MTVATKRRPKTKTAAQLRKQLWGLVSRYVRLSAAGFSGYACCVTCGAQKPWTELHAGHFVPQGRGNVVRYDLRNIHPQCYRCNISLGGNPSAYAVYMLDNYGERVIRDLESRAHGVVKFSLSDYRDMISDFTDKLERLESGDIPRTWQEDHVS